MYNIVANVLSGKGAGKKCLEEVRSYLNEKGLEFQIDIIDGRGAGKRITQRLCEKGASVVVAIGGDGTFHEVLNGMDFSKAKLGFVPAGRGNDFARGAGFSFDPKEAIDAIVRAKESNLDYIQVGKRRCLNACGTGLDVEVLRLTDQKNYTYVGSLSKTLMNFKPYKVRVEACGKKTEYECVTAILCNGTQYGGGMKVCPPAKIDDGLLDLMILEKPKVPALFVMPSFVRGKHIGKYYCTHVPCETATIINESFPYIQIDGEIYEGNKLEGRIVRGGLKTFLP